MIAVLLMPHDCCLNQTAAPKGDVNELSSGVLNALIAAHEDPLDGLPLGCRRLLKHWKLQVFHWLDHGLHALDH